MSSRSRRADRSSTAENAIQQAHGLVAATDTASIETVWDNLCLCYSGISRDSPPPKAFPHWVLQKVPHEVIPVMLEAVYGRGAKGIEFHAPSLCKRFAIPQWHFILFLGRLSQPKVVILNKIAKKHGDITFDRLYRELYQIRSQREPLPKVPCDFTLGDFRICHENSKFENENQNNSEVDYRNADKVSGQTICLSSDEDDYDQNDDGNEDDDNETDSAPDLDESSGPRSSVGDTAHGVIIPRTSANPLLSLRNSVVDVPNIGESGSGVMMPTASRQGQDIERQDVEPDREPTVNFITVTAIRTRVDTEEQNTCTYETTCQTLASLESTCSERVNKYQQQVNTVQSLKEESEELRQKQIDIGRRIAKIKQSKDAEIRHVTQFLETDPECNSEQMDVVKSHWSRLKDLSKKRKSEEMEHEIQRARWVAFEAKVREVQASIKQSDKEN